jgi:carboxyl-terminal processing protease
LTGHEFSTVGGLSPVFWLSAWAVGVVLTGAPIVLGLFRLGRLARASEPVTDEAMLGSARRLAARVGVRRPVRLVLGSGREVPMTWGIFRPVILLPSDAARWPEGRLATALAHELAHVRRWDCLTHLLARSACALYWFNPLSWLALARVRAEQEQACDDLAVRSGLDRVSYADHLLAILAGRTSRSPGSPTAVALAMSAGSRLEGRLREILDARRSRRAPGRRTVGLATAAAVALLVPLAAVSPRAGAEALLGPGPDSPAQATADGTAQDAKPVSGSVESEVLEKVREVYVKAPDESALRLGAIRGILEALHDPYSTYIEASQLAEMERSIQGKLTGIGAKLEPFEGRVRVVTPLPDSPAFKAGVRPGDVIEEVDGQPTRGLELTEVVRRIIGEAGKAVRLRVRHEDGRTEELNVTRGAITVRSVQGYRLGRDGRWDFMLDPDHGIGFVRLTGFNGETPGELKEALERLKGQGVKGAVLDLRGCPGGLMSAAVDSARHFLAKGTIVTIRGRDEAPKSFKAEGQAAAPDLPMVVLIDDTTASAAEILAGALKNNDRAILLGSRTHGKGSVQTIVKLKDGSGAIRLTSAYYELPGGENIDKRDGKETWGVDPTDGYFVPLDGPAREALNRRRLDRERLGGAEPPTTGGAKVSPELIERDQADPQLGAALKTLTARTTGGTFVKVGLPVAEQSARLKRLQDVRKRRQSLLDDLRTVERELSELDRVLPAGR